MIFITDYQVGSNGYNMQILITDDDLMHVNEMAKQCGITAKSFVEKTLIDSIHNKLELTKLYAALTLREQEVATFVFNGSTYKEIAAVLGLSPETVKCHVRNIYRKVGCKGARGLREKFRFFHARF